MEPILDGANAGNPANQAIPKPEPTWLERKIINYVRDNLKVESTPDQEGMQNREVTDETRALKQLFSELPDVIFQTNSFQSITLKHEAIITELKPEIKNCLEGLFHVIFQNLSGNSKTNESNSLVNNNNINGTSIPALPQTKFNNFIERLKGLYEKHLGSLNDNSDDDTKKNAFRKIARELLETAFPEKQNDKNLPPLLKTILAGKGMAWVASWWYSEIADFTWDKLIDLCGVYGAKLFDSKLKNTIKADELSKYEGVKELSELLAKHAIPIIKEDDNVKFEKLGLSKESAKLLNNALNNLKNNLSSDNWLWIEGTLENAISHILCTIFEPKPPQGVEARYNEFVDSIAQTALVKIPEWKKWEAEIQSYCDNATAENLKAMLDQLEKMQNSKANSSVKKTIDLSSHTALRDLLETDLSGSILVLKKMLREKNLEKDKLKEHFIQICYSQFAKDLLEEELKVQDLKKMLDIPPLVHDNLFSLLYSMVGGYLKEIKNHIDDIENESKAAEAKIQEWKIEGLDTLINNALETLTGKLETMADDVKNPLIKNYEFLNKITCHLLRKPVVGNNQSKAIADMKKEVLKFIQDLIKIITVKEISHNLKNGGTPEQAFKNITDNLLDKADKAIEAIDSNLGLVAEDQQNYETIIQSIFDALKPNNEFPLNADGSKKALPSFDSIKQNPQDVITFGENSINIFAKLFSFPENQEGDKKIRDKIVLDAYNFITSECNKDMTVKDVIEKLVIDWKIKRQTKKIFKTVLPKKSFDELLPVSFRDIGLWEMTCQELLYPHLKGIYSLRKVIDGLSGNNKLQLEPALDVLVDENLPKLTELLIEQKTENDTIDRFLGEVMAKEGKLSETFNKYLLQILSPLLKSFLAYHTTPKDDRTTSAELFSKLLWKVISTGWTDFNRAKIALEQGRPEEEVKGFLKTGAIAIANIVFPQELWNSLVPKDFGMLTREQVVELIFALLEKGLQDYVYLHDLLTKYKQNLSEKDSAFLEEQAGILLAAPTKENPRIFHENPFFQTVISHLLIYNRDDKDNPLNLLVEAGFLGFFKYVIGNISKSGVNNNNIVNNNNVVIPNDNNKSTSLLDKLAMVASMTKPRLDWINQPTPTPCWEPEDMTEYLAYTSKTEIVSIDEHKDFVYWSVIQKIITTFFTIAEWKQALPIFLRGFFTINHVAGFLVPYLKEYQNLRDNLIAISENVHTKVNDVKLMTLFEETIFGSVKEALQSIGYNDEALKTLPPFARTILIQLLQTNNQEIDVVRTILLKQVIYVLFDRLKDPNNINSAKKMMEAVDGVVQEFQAGKNDLEIATCLCDQVFDAEFMEKMFQGVMNDIVNRDRIIGLLTPLVAEIRKSITTLKDKENKAVAFFKGNDIKNHGINQLLAQAFYSLDAMIDEYAKMDGKIAEDQPLLINDLIKKAFGSGQTAPIIKDAIHSIIKIALHEKLKVTQGDDSQKKIIQLVKDIVGVFKSPNSIQKLLELLLPEKLVKEIVPPSLINLFYKVKDDLSPEKEFTLSKIVEWFFKKDSEEIENIKKNYKNYTLPVQNDPKIQRLTGWIERLLGDQKMIEDLIFENGQINEDIGSYLDIVMNEIKPQVGELLKPKFLSYVLNEALKDVNAIQFPLRADGSIMNDAEREKFFNDEVGNKFISIILKNAKKPFPTMVETALKSAVVSAMENFTKKNNRVVFVNNFIKPPNNPIMDGRIQGLASQIDKINPPANFDEAAFLRENEIIFKKNIVPFARKKIDEYVDSEVSWSGFRKWITRLFYKIVVSLVMNISLKHRLWRFLSDPHSDVVIQKIIWKFMTVGDSYKGEEVVEGSLTEAFKGFFEQQNLIPGMIRGLLAKQTAASIFPQDIVDLVAPVPPAQPAQAVV